MEIIVSAIVTYKLCDQTKRMARKIYVMCSSWGNKNMYLLLVNCKCNLKWNELLLSFNVQFYDINF